MSEYDRIDLFVTHTGTVHYAAQQSWGPGMECSSRFVIGERTDGLEGSVNCQRCITNHLPTVYEIRVPDKRTKIGYRVAASTQDPEVVEELLSIHGNGKAYVEETKGA